MKKLVLNILIISISIFIIGCWIFNTDIELQESQFNIVDLDYADLFYSYTPTYYQLYEAFQYTMDDTGVIISVLPHGGTMYYYHSTNVGSKGTNFFY